MEEGNIVKTNIVDIGKKIDAKEILDMSMELNSMLSGLRISELENIKISSANEKKIIESIKDSLMSENKGENEETGLNIYIGEESSVNAMKNCSVITANCDFGNSMKGTIGVVGPKRMDYEKVLKAIKSTMQNISKELK